MREATVGLGGAAGDGLASSGNTLARTAGRLGLYLYAYNSYQSIIRGGHIWLRLRIGEEKVYSQGDNLNFLVAFNQDTIERHAREVESGGAIIYNSDRLNCPGELVPDNVLTVPLPIRELVKSIGRVPPIMNNTVLLGALLFLIGLEFKVLEEVLSDTFAHKGAEVIDKNVAVARAGYSHVENNFVPLGFQWNFSRTRRPFVTGNEAFALGAVTAGCKFYSAYPMTPASGILHWMAKHGEECGVLVKQGEDELSVANMAIGAGHAGVRAMCATSGGGFALMTEAIGQAAMIEAPVVIVNVQRAGPSTGVPTKTEQGDLNQVYGASQGDFPRVIMAPTDVVDCFHSTVEAFNLAEKYQLPVLIISDLLLSEHPESVDRDSLKTQVDIDRGEIIREWPTENGPFQRYKMTSSGISPRALPGTENTVYVAATDDHDESGILISDMFTSPSVRRKIQEKRMKKVDLIGENLPALEIYGPAEAEVTLIGWGSTKGVIREAVDVLNNLGVTTNQLQVKYLMPFQSEEIRAIMEKSKQTFCVEVNYTGQFARFLRAETGLSVSGLVLKYDGEPMEPAYIVSTVQALMKGQTQSLELSMDEAREMTYHYIRTQLDDSARPGGLKKRKSDNYDEFIWLIEVLSRKNNVKQGDLIIGAETGSIHNWKAEA